MPTAMKIVPDLPSYLADSDGGVWRLKDGTLTPVKVRKLKNGYMAFNGKHQNGKWVTTYLHRAVASAWLGPAPAGAQTRHLDGDKLNARPSNLAWGDARLNTLDRRRHGRSLAGTRNGAAKINPTIAYCIREMVKFGLTRRAVAKHFGICYSTVSDVVAGKRWVETVTAAQVARDDPPTLAV